MWMMSILVIRPLFLSFLDPRRSLEGLPVWCGGPSSILPAWNGIYWEARKQINMQTIDARCQEQFVHFEKHQIIETKKESSRVHRTVIGPAACICLYIRIYRGQDNTKDMEKGKGRSKGLSNKTITNNN